MLFDEYQEPIQIWRFGEPTNIYTEDEWLTDDGWSLTIGYDDISTSGGIYKRDFFNECRTNIQINVDFSGPTSVVLCGEGTDDLYVPFTTLTAVSGNNTLSYSLSGTTFYTGLGMIFDTGVRASVNWIYVGDKSYATKDSPFVDGMWKYIKSITARIEPVNAGDSLYNQQTFSNVTDIGFIPYDYKSDVLAGDGIVDVDNIQRKVVGQPQWFKYEIPYVEVRLERMQFTVIS